METYERILVFNNEYEAELMEEVLLDKKIPYGIIPHADSVLEGINQMEFGWGYLEAPAIYRREIEQIYKELQKEE